MAKHLKKQAEDYVDSESYTFNDDRTKKKIKKHIQDIRDVISEEDIANAKVPGEQDKVRKPQAEEEKKEETPSEGKPITPWDIIN